MIPSRSFTVLVGLVLSLLAALATDTGAGALFRHPRALSLRPEDGMSDEARLQLASTNVQAHVERNRVNGPLAEALHDAKLMELDDAAETIAALERDRRGLHHRLALISLLSWKPGDRDVRRAVELLVGPQLAARIYADLAVPPHPDSCQGDADWEETQLRVNAALNDSLGPLVKDQCDPVEAMLASTYDVGDGAIGIVSKVIATAPLDTAEKGLDAQSWRRCSTLWSDSFMVKLDMSGNVEDNGTCVSPTDPACYPKRGQERPYDHTYDTSDPLPKRPLFERVVCDGGWCDVRVLLRIKTKVDNTILAPDPVYKLEYLEPAKWRGFNVPVVDGGNVSIVAESATPPKKRLTVESNKVFAFDRQATNAATAFALKRVQMGRYMADLVCCNP